MSTEFKEFIKLVYEDNLDLESTKSAFELIMSGKVNDIQISSFLSLLQISGVRSYHILGASEVMQKKMVPIKSSIKTMDTCGTGGDGKNSLNISTATAFVLAAAGIPIAKHGNKALTSKCGSADVLEALGVNINLEVSKLEKCIKEIGICFMFAPNHHPAMKHVGPVRQQLGIRTIFNMLGPLLNPANTKNQLVGVYSKDVFKIYREVFDQDKEKNICLVYGHDGNDEISLDGLNLIYSKKSGIIEFDPQSVGLPRSKKNEIIGGDAAYNAKKIIELFSGIKDSFYHTVCINSVFGILLDQNLDFSHKNIINTLASVQNIIDHGTPLKILERLAKFTK